MSYVFELGRCLELGPSELLALVGAKAANLGIMAEGLNLPVPPGFVITTEACRVFRSSGWPEGLDKEIRTQVRRLEEKVGRRFGDPAGPLLVSVRSGAPVSMPGMMDTILNLGLNPSTVDGLAALTGKRQFAEDCWRRFARMYREVVGEPIVPEDPWLQLKAAVEAVFRSWDSERAIAYRKREGIPDDLCTAVTVQAMVFGNLGGASCTGVVFTRNPSSGEPELFGDVVFGGQGEDVVGGMHRTEDLSSLDARLPAVSATLRNVARVLERHFGDLCEIEFTVEEGQLWLLQVRQGKRSPQAALRIAVDMAEEEDFPLSREEAVRRVAGQLSRPPTNWTCKRNPQALLAKGLAASPGLASGEIVTTREEAEACASAGRPLILVRPDTSPEDVPSISLASGIVTCRGGLTSHAAVIARDWAIPAVIGAPIELNGGKVIIGDRVFKAGDTLTIDGSTGEIFAGKAEGLASIVPEAAVLLGWAAEAGIDIWAAIPGEAGPGSEAAGDLLAPDEVIRALYIKEAAPLKVLADALGTAPEPMRAALAELQEKGFVKLRGDFAQVTEAGRLRGRTLLEADAARWGRENAAMALESFIALDVRMKELVTDWQLRALDGRMVVNDHSDRRYDAWVLARLRSLHQDVLEWFAAVEEILSRFRRYEIRLSRAIDRASSGEHQFVASASVDSYHGTWFELHEELIRLAGRSREEEVAAGRA